MGRPRAQGCSRSADRIVNGVPYIVTAITAKTVTVDMDQRFWLKAEPSKDEVGIKLTHKEVAELLRLTHALVYANVQGRTIRNKHVVLLDTHHRHFTMRHLIVGMSRVTDGKYLHIPTRDQEEALMEKAPQLEEDVLIEDTDGEDEDKDEDEDEE